MGHFLLNTGKILHGLSSNSIKANNELAQNDSVSPEQKGQTHPAQK